MMKMTEDKNIFDFTESDRVDNEFVKFDDDHKEVIGILISIDQGSFGDQYLIETKDKKIVVVGSYTALKDKIKKDYIGKPIKINYKGKQKSQKSNRVYDDFDVYVKK